MFVLLALFVSVAFAGPLAATRLLVNRLPSPLGVDVTPYFSWTVDHTDRAQSQQSYRVEVSSNSAFTASVWDSGTVSSNVSDALYAGSALVSDRTYYWRVTWTDSNGNQAPTSAVATFDTGLLTSADWKNAVYISGDAQTNNGNNLFQTTFTLPAGLIVRARAYVVGLGYYHLFLNGAKASTHSLGPAWTQYQKRILYVTHDVASFLKAGGSNAVGVMLGTGWRNESTFPNLDNNTPASDNHRQVLKLIITVDIGQLGNTSTAVVTSGSWKTTAGPVTFDAVYDGETYDARREIDGWNTPTFNASSWANVGIVAGPPGVLSSQMIPEIKESQRLSVRAITNPSAGVYVVDFGQNFQGYTQITLTNPPAGTRVQLRHAEILNDNGDGNIYTDNLRSAKATDVYYARGLATETYHPYFTYHGFRYVEVTGWPGGAPPASAFVGIHFHSALPVRGNISFGLNEGRDNILNMIHHAVVWGQRSNMISVLSDCDQRDERLGWMGDASLSSESIAFNFNAAAFYANLARNMLDEQNQDGTVPDVVPFYRYGSRPADPAWGAAYPQTVYSLYKYYGDMVSAKAHYQPLTAWVNYLSVATPNLSNMYSYYGDWVPPPPNGKCSGSLVSAFNWIANLRQIAEIASALGYTDDAAKWNSNADALSNSFNQAWFKSSTNTYDNGLQTCVALALHLGIVPQANYIGVVNNLLNDIVSTHNSQVTTGITGLKFLLQVLTDMGRSDIALEVSLGVDYPSYAWMMVNPYEPATTIWELWDAPNEGPGMNSRNHHMYSSVGQTIHQSFAGIRQARGSINYEEIVLHPQVLDYISRVNAQITTAYGNYTSNWSRDGGVQCSKAPEGGVLHLNCGSGGTISSIQFASFGRASGYCGGYGMNSTCHASNSSAIVSAACVGKTSCTVNATDAQFGDPCYGYIKWLVAQAVCSFPSVTTATISIPTNRRGVVRIPVLTLDELSVKESMGMIWSGGKFASGVAGVTNANLNLTTNTLDIYLGSGNYTFLVTGVEGTHVCGEGGENSSIVLTCPANKVISYVAFASFGTSPSSCGQSGTPIYNRGICHAGSSKSVVERACIGQASCTITVSDDVFGDPCYGTVKKAIVDVVCAGN